MTTVRELTERKMSVLYDGTNSADIDALVTYFDIVSESSGVLTFTSGGGPLVVNAGEYLIFFQGFVYGVFDYAAYSTYFTEVATQGDFSALASDVQSLDDAVITLSATLAGIDGAAVRSVGTAVCPLLLLGVPVDVAVKIAPAMPDTLFTGHAVVWGGVGLSSVTINSVTVTNTSTVTVNLETSLVSLAGVNILVTATS